MASRDRIPSRAHQIGHSPLKREVPCSDYLGPNNLPDITSSTLILGICGPNTAASNPEIEGHYVSEFYAFNARLRGLGAKQTWITASPPRALVSLYGNYSHGSPYSPSKVVLSDEIIKKCITPPLVCPGEMVKTFFRVLEEYRNESEDTGAPIVVFVFGPVSCEIEDNEYYRIEYVLGNGEHGLWDSVSGQFNFKSFEAAVAIKNTVLIRPECCSRIPEFKSLFDGTIKCPETFVRQLAREHHESCAGDWHMEEQGKFRPILSRFLQNKKPTREDIQEAYDFIEFRVSTMDLADTMVDRLGLPRPLNRRCIWWNRRQGDFEGRNGTCFKRIQEIWFALSAGGIDQIIPLRRTSGKAIHWEFTRPQYYLAAAMELAGWELDQVAGAVAKMKEWKKLYEYEAVEEEEDDDNEEGWDEVGEEGWVQLEPVKHWWKNIEENEESGEEPNQPEATWVGQELLNHGGSYGRAILNNTLKSVSRWLNLR